MVETTVILENKAPSYRMEMAMKRMEAMVGAQENWMNPGRGNG